MHNLSSGLKEFAVKNIWHLIKEDSILKEYLPYKEMAEGRHPDKIFV
jgi:hypothetical protein